MSNNIDLFYDMAIKRIESLENPSEFEIENELRQLANGVPYFESINEQNIYKKEISFNSFELYLVLIQF